MRRSYVLWKKIVSRNGQEECDSKPDEGKFWVYEQAIHVPF